LSEKHLKKLIGKAEIKDGLKRLDKLTNEEVRIVTVPLGPSLSTSCLGFYCGE
jgi:hypothetical protein